MRTPHDGKRRRGGPPKGSGGGAFERIKQDRDARGLEVPDVEHPPADDALSLEDDEPVEAADSSPDDRG